MTTKPLFEPYKNYHQCNLIKDWEQLIKMTREDIIKLNEQWKIIDQENENNMTLRRTVVEKGIEDIQKIMRQYGIDPVTYNEKLEKKFDSWFKKNIKDVLHNYLFESCPDFPKLRSFQTKTVNNVELKNIKTPIDIVELYDNLTEQYKNKLEQTNKDEELFQQYIQYAIDNRINIYGLDKDQVISFIEEKAKKEEMEDLFDGEIICFDECECQKYVVGNDRCECGNRRVGVEVEGNIIEGFYYSVYVY